MIGSNSAKSSAYLFNGMRPYFVEILLVFRDTLEYEDMYCEFSSQILFLVPGLRHNHPLNACQRLQLHQSTSWFNPFPKDLFSFLFPNMSI